MKRDPAERMHEIIERSLRGEASDAEVRELSEWRRASPENEQTYRELERLIEATGLLRLRGAVPPRPSAAAIAAAVEAGRGGRRWSLVRWLPWSVAAAAVLLASASVLRRGDPVNWAPAEVVTGAAELATVKLGDGTVVRVGPASRLQVHADRPREVSLEGRAFFAVTNMPDQPFRVRTRAATANVLGTRFELATHGDGVRLRVVEGRVELAAPANRVEVGAGETSDVRNGEATPPQPLASGDTVPSWVGTFMVFQASPLNEAAREIERLYGVRVVIEDSTLASATITASFTDQPIGAVINVVCAVLSASCTLRDSTVAIQR